MLSFREYPKEGEAMSLQIVRRPPSPLVAVVKTPTNPIVVPAKKVLA